MKTETRNNLKYLLFCTSNEDGRELYEIHETATPYKFDGYLGQGVWTNDPLTYRNGKKPLHVGILRHGLRSYRRRNIEVFDNLKDAEKYYLKIVGDDKVVSPKTYNDYFIPIKRRKKKEVYQYSVDGDLITTYSSIEELSNKYNLEFRTIVDHDVIFDESIWSTVPYTKDSIMFDKQFNVPLAVKQYTRKGEYMTFFKDTKDAAMQLDLDQNALIKAVYRHKLYSNYYFLQGDEDIANIVYYHKKPKKQRNIPVYRYLPTGEFDTSFPSVTEGARHTRRTSINAIKKACINQRQIFGYRWSYNMADTWQEAIQMKTSDKYRKTQRD